MEARDDVAALIEEFAIEKIARNPARFDVNELERLNARLLHEADYADVKGRLEAMGADQGEAFWLAVRPNLERLSDVKEWLRLVEGPVEPVVEAEDAQFIAKAAELLPSGALGPTSWQDWTAALKDATGRKGKSLFMPLRLALTGQPRGPEMSVLLPLIGRKRTVERLGG
mgnify:CR=1 FL=1